MRLHSLAGIVGLSIIASPVLAVDMPLKFDLACSGINQGIQDSDGNFTESAGLPAPTHYRINMATGRWCEGKCKVVLPVVQKTGIILLVDETKLSARSMAFRWPAKSLIEVTMLPTRLGLSLLSNFQCRLVPFSGLPT